LIEKESSEPLKEPIIPSTPQTSNNLEKFEREFVAYQQMGARGTPFEKALAKYCIC
jgi:hypothetical protein